MESRSILSQNLVDYELISIAKGDYHFVENEDGAVWAEPSITHLAKQMQVAIEKAKDPQFKSALQKYVKETFDPARTGRLLTARLAHIKATFGP